MANRRSVDTSIERRPLGKQIAEVLRHDILYGRLEPGTKLAQQQLCEEFGTSRMPVRDALRQLQYEGFIISDEGQHSVVAPISREDLTDSFLIEGMLHGLAARRATERMDDDELAQLRELHEQMLEASGEGDLALMAELNWEFHREINQMSRSRKVIAALRVVSISVPRDYLVEFPEWVDRSNHEHEQMLEAMEEGKADEVERLIQIHLSASGEDLAEYLEDKGLTLE